MATFARGGQEKEEMGKKKEVDSEVKMMKKMGKKKEGMERGW